MKDYVEEGMSRQERVDMQKTKLEMRDYLLSIKEYLLGGLRCEYCGQVNCSYDLHSIKYSNRQTIDDLVLLCKDCHKQQHDYIRLDYKYKHL